MWEIEPFSSMINWALYRLWRFSKTQWMRRAAYYAWLKRNWWTVSVILAFGWVGLHKDTQIDVGFLQPDTPFSLLSEGLGEINIPIFWKKSNVEREVPVNTSQLSEVDYYGVEDANSFSNMEWAQRPGETAKQREARLRRRKKRINYVNKYAGIAQKEMDLYGIPASITLAQGLLESNAGESRLAVKNKNHFGIKCFSRRCKKGHCSNFNDDHHKDFFRIYPSVLESYRAHSKFLQASRYQKLFKLKQTDYKGWAHGLKKAGYATDPRYGYKLISLIEDLKLHQFDK